MANETDNDIGTIADAPDTGAPDSAGGDVPQGEGADAGGAVSPESVGTIADDEPGTGDAAPEADRQEADQGEIEREAYTLNPGDAKDFPVAPESLSEFTAVCKALKMDKAQAQGVLDHIRKKYQADQQWFAQDREKTLSAWQRQIFEDREFGGSNYRSTIADGRKALAAFDPDGSVRALLRETGAERHPAVVRLACRIGRAMGEHKFVGANGAGANDGNQPLWKRMYGESGTEQLHSTY